VSLPDNTRVTCKRKGLRITLCIGTKKGDGLMRRIDVSPDPWSCSKPRSGGGAAGVRLQIADGRILIEP
jgi:hypothetical protein